MKWKLLALAVLAAALLAACGAPKVATVQITGVVVNSNGLPVPGIRVLVPGQSVVTTDGSGRFSFDGITTPYTLIVEQKSNDFVVYQGLTRTDPYVFVNDSTGSYSADVSGDVQSTTSGDTVGVQVVSDHALGYTSVTAPGSTTSYSLNVKLLQPVASAAVYALEWSEDANGNAQDFAGYGTHADLNLATGDNLANVDVLLTPISGTHDLTVTTDIPTGLNPSIQAAGVRFAAPDVWGLAIVTYQDTSPAGAQFTVRSPTLAAARTVLYAAASGGSQLFSVRWTGVPTSATAHTLALYDPVALLEPSDGASIAADAPFRWQPPDGAITMLAFSGDLNLTVYTAGSEFVLPDLSPFGASYGTNPYTWQVVAFRLDGLLEGDLDQLTAAGQTPPMLILLATFFGAPLSESGYMVSSDPYGFSLQ
ncbi:hypothetical protein Ocepr_0377 [Oceanithermus profundus DSM 14977]|uniref:Carboxypeptidase regulatory-like domain-containing protein n=1 Tax=Oceanithermus profundus (strain DSM 14977 / NBRC 100410 / VKM B-2274 / 506) TaxID=670487 RepID=E4U616_OCEP5|nr:carboxypeptidase-like regulatory domain-containing protein [Oceanithermus profundus]ADR35837.1 hypothetical protein Ocepr_0377 [Oceanithermus profundus DSM 14977]